MAHRKKVYFSQVDPKNGEESIKSEKNINLDVNNKEIQLQNDKISDSSKRLVSVIPFSELWNYFLMKIKIALNFKLSSEQKIIYEAEKKLEKSLNIKLVLRKLQKFEYLYLDCNSYLRVEKQSADSAK